MRARIILGATASQTALEKVIGERVDIMGSNRKRVGPALGAALFATIVATSGCQEPTKVAAKSPTPVHVVEVALYSPSEDLRYSASVIPFAEAVLSFKSAGYVTEIKQVTGADGRRRNIGSGDYVGKGAVLAQIRHQDLKNQLDQVTATLSKLKPSSRGSAGLRAREDALRHRELDQARFRSSAGEIRFDPRGCGSGQGKSAAIAVGSAGCGSDGALLGVHPCPEH